MMQSTTGPPAPPARPVIDQNWTAATAKTVATLIQTIKQTIKSASYGDEQRAAALAPLLADLEKMKSLLETDPLETWHPHMTIVDEILSNLHTSLLAPGSDRTRAIDVACHWHNQFEQFFKNILIENSRRLKLAANQDCVPSFLSLLNFSTDRILLEKGQEVYTKILTQAWPTLARSDIPAKLRWLGVHSLLARFMDPAQYWNVHRASLAALVALVAAEHRQQTPTSPLLLLYNDAITLVTTAEELEHYFRSSMADPDPCEVDCWVQLSAQLPRQRNPTSDDVVTTPLTVIVSNFNDCLFLRENALRMLSALFRRRDLPLSDTSSWWQLVLANLQHDSFVVQLAAADACDALFTWFGPPIRSIHCEIADAALQFLSCLHTFEATAGKLSEHPQASELVEHLTRTVLLTLRYEEDIAELANRFYPLFERFLFLTESDSLQAAYIDFFHLCLQHQPSVQTVHLLFPFLGRRSLHAHIRPCLQLAIDLSTSVKRSDPKQPRIEAVSVANPGSDPMVSTWILDDLLNEVCKGELSVLDTVLQLFGGDTTGKAAAAESRAMSLSTALEHLGVFEIVLSVCAYRELYPTQLQSLSDLLNKKILQPLQEIPASKLSASPQNIPVLLHIIDICALLVSVAGGSRISEAVHCALYLFKAATTASALQALAAPALTCLALAPGGIVVKQRCDIFMDAVQLDPPTDVTFLALRQLPLLLHNIGTVDHVQVSRAESYYTAYLTQSRPLVSPFIRTISNLIKMKSENGPLLELIATIIGSLACVAAGMSSVELRSLRHPVTYSISCSCGSMIFLRERASRRTHDVLAQAEFSADYALVYEEWESFKSLLAPSSSDAIRLAFATNSLRQFVTHCAAIPLLKDVAGNPKSTQGNADLLNWASNALSDSLPGVQAHVAASMPAFVPSLDCFFPLYTMVKEHLKTPAISSISHPQSHLAAIGALGCITHTRQNTLSVLYRIVKLMSTADSHALAGLRQALERMSALRGFTVPRAWLTNAETNFRGKLSKLLVREDRLLLLTEELFAEDKIEFIDSTVKSWLPFLIHHRMKYHDRTLRLAQSLGLELRDLFVRNWPVIFAKLLLRPTTAQDRQAEMAYLRELLGPDYFHEILRKYAPDVVSVMSMSSGRLSLEEKKNRLHSMLNMWHDLEEGDAKNAKLRQKAIRKLIVNNFLYMDITFFRPNLNGKLRSVRNQLRALSGLRLLFQFLGKDELLSLRVNIIALIKLLLSPQHHSLRPHESVLTSALELYDFYIRQVPVESVAQYLGQIFIDVLPHARQCPVPVLSLLRYLIIDNAETSRPFFKDIHVLPEQDSELHEIRKAIEKDSQREPEEEIRHLLNVIRGDNVDLPALAVSRLKELLITNISALIRQQDRVSTIGTSSLLSDLLQTLLLASRDKNYSRSVPSVANLAVCIGIIGAVDPGRIDTTLSRTEPEKPVAEIDDVQLASELVEQHLVRLLSHTTMSPAAAYTIQVLIESYKERLLLKLSSQASQTVQPYRTSRYKMGGDKSKYAAPIYKPTVGYARWVSSWAGSLLRFASSPVFRACVALAGTSSGWTSIAHFLLPHLVMEVVRNIANTLLHQEGVSPVKSSSGRRRSKGAAEDEERPPAPGTTLSDQQLEEARSVLLSELAEILSTSVSAALAHIVTSDPVEAAVNAVQQTPASGQPTVSARSQHDLVLQDVFACMDFMQRIRDHETAPPPRGSAAAKSKPANRRTDKHRFWDKVDDVFRQIPHLQLQLAKAAFSCKAYTRALMHLENHIRLTAAQALVAAAPPSNTRTTRAQAFAPVHAVTLRRSAVAEHSALLQAIYGALDEPDGVEGVSLTVLGVSTNQNVDTVREVAERAIQCENAQRWQEAFDAYDETMRSHAARSLPLYIGHARCLMHLGKYETLLLAVQGYPVRNPSLQAYAVQAACRLGHWDSLTNLLNDETTFGAQGLEDVFQISVGRLLLHARKGQNQHFASEMQRARSQLLMPSLAAASTEAYSRAYPIIVKLHILHELEQAVSSRASQQLLSSSSFPDWPARLNITQPSLKTRESILAARAAIWEWKGCANECGAVWLDLARLSRKNGQLSLASSALAQAEQRRRTPLVSLERAKLLWVTGQQHQHRALANLQDLLRRLESETSTAESNSLRSRVMVLLGRWMQATGLKKAEPVIEMFKAAQKLSPTSEKAHFVLGKYYDELMMAARGGTRSIGRALVLSAQFDAKTMMARLPDVLYEYGSALKYGHTFLYHALPRLLTLWLDHSAILPELSQAVDERPQVGEEARTGSRKSSSADSRKALIAQQKEAADILEKSLKIMRELIDALPPYIWLSSFSQIVSRICHKNTKTAELLTALIATVVAAHPQQTLWSMASILPNVSSDAAAPRVATQAKSDRPERVARAKTILQVARDRTKSPSSFDRLVKNYSQFVQSLLAVCNYGIGQKNLRSLRMAAEMSTEAHKLQTVLRHEFRILLPTTRTLTALLPFDHGDPNHVPFPKLDFITVERFGDEVEILPSLQKPKKIQLYASDGNTYLYLCKPKDDLRKDSRVMEFNQMINKLLRRDPESRRRNLHIRTYSVMVLNEECGLIEWVPNCVGFRNIMVSLNPDFDQNAPYMRDLYENIGNNGKKIEQNVASFKKILEMHPASLSQWFLQRGHSPSAWLESRLAFTRTTAVMSMVGYIIGLGDRHGENLLLDERTGDLVHVDINCLFWKGRTFQQPERVPFRLTQNMVEAMGATGYEGPFRRASEITLRLLRHHRDSLLSVLETFIHDPLIEWTSANQSKSSSRGGQNASNDLGESEAVRIVGEIEKALQGKTEDGLFVSVEGQVHQLIEEATSLENLCMMYIGWSAWW